MSHREPWVIEFEVTMCVTIRRVKYVNIFGINIPCGTENVSGDVRFISCGCFLYDSDHPRVLIRRDNGSFYVTINTPNQRTTFPFDTLTDDMVNLTRGNRNSAIQNLIEKSHSIEVTDVGVYSLRRGIKHGFDPFWGENIYL